MTVPKPIEPRLTKRASKKLPALPPKRVRRRSTRSSHAWRFRKPPSRKRVEAAAARFQPQAVPAPQRAPLTEAPQ
jgi:hypothetical protein